MTSGLLENLTSIEECKIVLDEDCSSNNPYLETVPLLIGNEDFSRAKWFKGSKDRGFKGTLAAQK